MKRRGVIAALLAAPFGSFGQNAPGFNEYSGGLIIEIQKGPRRTGLMTACKSGTSGSVICEAEARPEPAYAIEVRYGDRVVRLTASEIMDALEGK